MTILKTWRPTGHPSSCPGGQINLIPAVLNIESSTRSHGVCFRIDRDTWGKSTSDGSAVHLTEEGIQVLIDELSTWLSPPTEKASETPVITETPKMFSTVVQDKVWNYLTSGAGTTALRQEALQLLSAASFFSPFEVVNVAERERLVLNRLKGHLDSLRFDKFCLEGKNRLLDAVTPVAPENYEAVIEIRVPVTGGRDPERFKPENDDFGGGSISEFTALSVHNLLQDQISSLHTKVSDDYFQVDGTRHIKAISRGCEKSK